MTHRQQMYVLKDQTTPQHSPLACRQHNIDNGHEGKELKDNVYMSDRLHTITSQGANSFLRNLKEHEPRDSCRKQIRARAAAALIQQRDHGNLASTRNTCSN